MKQEIKLFEKSKVRTSWDEKSEKWYFSIVDIVGILTGSADPQTYWRVMKKRLLDEGNETVTNCNALKMQAADGKMRLTDVADQEQILRLVQSIPSPKAEPFKVCLACHRQAACSHHATTRTRRVSAYQVTIKYAAHSLSLVSGSLR